MTQTITDARRGTRRAKRAASDGSAGEAIRGRLAEHARMLWGVCYRMTGSAADAEDLVQETFVRAMERPPASLEDPIAPWLLRVAVNLGRDALRRRKRRTYVGTWLPSPIEDEEVASFEIEGEGGTEGRYDLIESVSFAFLVALEVLTPNQRAVLLLRDVLDRSVRETAEALSMSEANVKVVHHRARLALAPYEASRTASGLRPPTDAAASGVHPSADAAASKRHASADAARGTQEALERFLMALAAGDEAALMSVFAEGAEALSDGGGVFLASKIVVRGARRVARMYLGLAKKTTPVDRFEIRRLNGAPMLVAERAPHTGEAPRFVLGFDVDASGKITRIYSVLAPAKLSHVRSISRPQ